MVKFPPLIRPLLPSIKFCARILFSVIQFNHISTAILTVSSAVLKARRKHVKAASLAPSQKCEQLHWFLQIGHCIV